MLKKWIRKIVGLRPRERFVFHRMVLNPLRRKPDFFILGVQKAGTTSLFKYLIQQSSIATPIEKEIHYFNLSYDRPIGFYKAYFPVAFGKISGEASPDYFDHPDVPERVHRHFPNAKLIVILRDPVERAYSHYNMVRKYVDDLGTFEEAIRGEENKLLTIEQTKHQNPRGYGRGLSNYGFLNKGHYAEHLKRWLVYFPIDQFLFLDYTELIQRPEDTVQKVCAFMHVPFDGRPVIGEAHNKGAYDRQIAPETEKKLRAYFKEMNEEFFSLTGIRYDWAN